MILYICLFVCIGYAGCTLVSSRFDILLLAFQTLAKGTKVLRQRQKKMRRSQSPAAKIEENGMVSINIPVSIMRYSEGIDRKVSRFSAVFRELQEQWRRY